MIRRKPGRVPVLFMYVPKSWRQRPPADIASEIGADEIRDFAQERIRQKDKGTFYVFETKPKDDSGIDWVKVALVIAVLALLVI